MAHTSLRNHRKLRKLARLLKVPQVTAVGLLEHLWWAVAEVDSIGPDGRLDGWTAEDLASAASWAKDAVSLIEALRTSGFLDQSDDGTFRVHDWADWCPEYICKRWRDRGWVESGWKRPRLQKRSGVSKLVKTSQDQNTPNKATQGNPRQPNPTQPKSLAHARPRASPRGESVEAIYAAYPKKVGKGAALKAIRKALSKVERAALLAAVEAFAVFVAPKKGTSDWKFVPHPATWFNQERWADEPEPGHLASPELMGDFGDEP